MIDRAEWERRFKAHIVATLTRPLTAAEHAEALEDDPEFSPWTPAQALDAAGDEFASAHFDDISEGFEDDPEGAADECMSYWGD